MLLLLQPFSQHIPLLWSNPTMHFCLNLLETICFQTVSEGWHGALPHHQDLNLVCSLPNTHRVSKGLKKNKKKTSLQIDVEQRPVFLAAGLPKLSPSRAKRNINRVAVWMLDSDWSELIFLNSLLDSCMFWYVIVSIVTTHTGIYIADTPCKQIRKISPIVEILKVSLLGII